jgi:hypothetical protein
MSDRTGGVLSFVVDGQPLELEGSFSFMLQRFQRTSQQGLNGPAGHKREPSQPYIEGTCFYKSDTNVTILHNLTNITVQGDLYNGKKIVLFNADQVGEIDVDGAEGTFPIRFEGTDGAEL